MSATTTRKRPDRRKPPALPATAEPRTTELIGLTKDGRMVLWSTGMVQPVSAFETSPSGKRFIAGGHYVIDWKGRAITVHCSNVLYNGRWQVGIQFMGGNWNTIPFPRAQVEAMLMGKVIPDPVQEAEILQQLRELADIVSRGNDTPERQRGRLP